MIDSLANRVASVLPAAVRRPLGDVWLRVRRARSGAYSALGEEKVTRALLDRLGIIADVAVDIAACDGVTKSNTLALYESGWSGLAVEGDPDRFASLARAYAHMPHVSLARVWVTPGNVRDILAAAMVPREFGFLNLDLDSYDHFVLASMLEEYRPRLVCAEINEKIPPPLRFTVTYDPDHRWQLDHFYGQSLSKLCELAERAGYILVDLHYNNAFLAPAESGLASRSAEDAYRKGYLDRPDRLEVFPWNNDMEELHSLNAEEQLAFVRTKFAAYEGRYELDA